MSYYMCGCTWDRVAMYKFCPNHGSPRKPEKPEKDELDAILEKNFTTFPSDTFKALKADLKKWRESTAFWKPVAEREKPTVERKALWEVLDLGFYKAGGYPNTFKGAALAALDEFKKLIDKCATVRETADGEKYLSKTEILDRINKAREENK